MASMNVSVPDPMRDWVQSRVDTGRYASVSDYVRDLIRRDQTTATDEARWLAALDSSIKRGVTDSVAGRVHDAGKVFDRLEAKYAAMASATEVR
ncbi:MAG: type II toxin-antitoxin system ParD family antitoxin [Pseudomonadota bacterium]|nr:type II toxin-antitoxin system ParD family antitoxin [Pseudomonadota bacterium]